jgi:hypothetical protein
MTEEEFDQMLRKIDDVICPPVSESREDRQRRLTARARRRGLRRAAAARSGPRLASGLTSTRIMVNRHIGLVGRHAHPDR